MREHATTRSDDLLTPDDFPALNILANRLIAFEAHYNTAAQPFDWRFNHNDLN